MSRRLALRYSRPVWFRPMDTPLPIPKAPAHLRACVTATTPPSTRDAPSSFDAVPGAFDVAPSAFAATTRADVPSSSPPTTTTNAATTNAATTNAQLQPPATWQQDDVDAGRCRSYELGQPIPEGAAFSEVRYWTVADAREGRCEIFDINQPRPATAASVAAPPAAPDGPVTPALLASLVADGSAAALTYLRQILDDVTVPAALRIKAAQSLLTTLPKQINVTNELVVSARSYDALMAQAAELLAVRSGAGGAPRITDERERGSVIDVMVAVTAAENEAAV
jgi:hypothetical protein